MLLTPTRPGEGSVAEVFLRDFCRMFPKDSLCCFATIGVGYEVGISSPDLGWLPMEVRELPNEWAGAAYVQGDMQDVLVSHRRLSQVRIQSYELAREIALYARANHVEQIAAIVAGPATLYLAKAVAEELRVTLLPIIWDPIHYVARTRGYHKHAVERLKSDFAELMRMSTRAGVASHGMKKDIESRFAVESHVMISPVLPAGKTEERKDNEFRIVFAGSLYAATEFGALLKALDHLEWNVDGKQVALWTFGHVFNLPIFSAGKKANFRFLGYWKSEEAQDLLRQTDLGYVPYWFQEEYSDSVRQCFPNKLSLYLSAELPVLFHGPAESSVQEFLNRHPVGISCNRLDAMALAETIESFVRDKDKKEKIARARETAIAQELGVEPARARWQKFIGAGIEDGSTTTVALPPGSEADLSPKAGVH